MLVCCRSSCISADIDIGASSGDGERQQGAAPPGTRWTWLSEAVTARHSASPCAPTKVSATKMATAAAEGRADRAAVMAGLAGMFAGSGGTEEGFNRV